MPHAPEDGKCKEQYAIQRIDAGQDRRDNGKGDRNRAADCHEAEGAFQAAPFMFRDLQQSPDDQDQEQDQKCSDQCAQRESCQGRTPEGFGKILEKVVLYRGETCEEENGIHYKNVEEYLIEN